MDSIRCDRKGLFFTIDALIAAMIMIAGLLLMTSSYVSEQPRSLINTMSHDLLNILSTLQTHELNNSFIQELIDNGSITDPNLTLMAQIGEFWADGNLTLATVFAANVSEGILPEFFGYSISIDNDTIYARSSPVDNTLVTSKKIITGVQEGKPLKGFIAKARATSVQKTSMLTIPFSPAGAGWKGSAVAPATVQVIKIFELPNVTVLEAKAYLSLHLDRGSAEWDVVDINHGLCTITRDDMNLDPGSEGVFRVFSLPTSCFDAGNNTIKLDLRNTGYNAHIHPGTFFIIEYNLTEQVQTLESFHSQRIYFDNVNSTAGGGVSGAGPWAITPFHIPEDATNISVTIQVAGRGIVDYTLSCGPVSRRFVGWGAWRCKNAYDYMIFLNDDVPFDNDGSPATNPSYIYPPAQTAPYIVTGTNIIAVYFNNYEDDNWGIGTEIIYSDPLKNITGSSYVEVNYTAPPVLPFGVIEVRQVKEFGGLANPTKDSNFFFPVEAEGVSDVFVHPVEQYSYITQVFSDTGYPPGNLVFESPSSRAVPSSVMIPLSTIDSTPLMINYERIRETSGNDVLPNSTIDYGFYIRGVVGYGQVYSTWDEAIEDAEQRLADILGMYVNASDLVIENTTMAGVPSMWGPGVAEVRVWD
ncbi:MAG: hypothetical protein V1729_02185 [Candidatus Woesearchaeota archaeon]